MFSRGFNSVNVWVGIQGLVFEGVVMCLAKEPLYICFGAGQSPGFCFTQHCSGEPERVFGELSSLVVLLLPLSLSAFCSLESADTFP